MRPNTHKAGQKFKSIYPTTIATVLGSIHYCYGLISAGINQPQAVVVKFPYSRVLELTLCICTSKQSMRVICELQFIVIGAVEDHGHAIHDGAQNNCILLRNKYGLNNNNMKMQL